MTKVEIVAEIAETTGIDKKTFSLISSQHRQEIVKTMLKQILATTKSFEEYIS